MDLEMSAQCISPILPLGGDALPEGRFSLCQLYFFGNVESCHLRGSSTLKPVCLIYAMSSARFSVFVRVWDLLDKVSPRRGPGPGGGPGQASRRLIVLIIITGRKAEACRARGAGLLQYI